MSTSHTQRSSASGLVVAALRGLKSAGLPVRGGRASDAAGPSSDPDPQRLRLRQVAEVLTALPWFVGAPLYRPWHLRWGATDDEVGSRMPGDDLLPVSHFTATRAISIAAPPESVWPWLLQVGYHRAGFYSYDLLDSLGRPSAHTILPQWQSVRVGDVVAPMTDSASSATSFVIAAMSPAKCLVWEKPDSTWAWRLTSQPDGGTRLVTRLKQRYRPGFSAALTVPLLEFGDFPMMRKMLRGIKARAEAAASARAVLV